MWELGSRGVVLLISVTCGCILIYNTWGAILGLALSLVLVIYACYSLLVNDSLVSPHAYYVLDYLRDAIFEIRVALEIIVISCIEYVRKLWRSAICYYREHFPFRMDKRRRSNYQLSNDSYTAIGAKRRDTSSSRFSMIDQLSPIPHGAYRSRTTDTENKFYYADDHDRSRVAFGKHTSTPVLKPERRDSRNGDIGLFSSLQIPSKRTSAMYAQNHTLNRGENVTQFSPEGSPWGTSISPKMRSKASGIKTVQTVAGPLLASTRLNIDPKVYSDVSSPGLTTRLTKYATEANNKLTHQAQYGAGQFPKVNIYASQIPLLSAKSSKVRIPVTVRVAAPDVTRYSPPERQKLLSNICHMENKSPTSVVQVLKEISLKRHASRDDVGFDVAKKQKIDSFFNEEREILQETRQKRGRDDSSISEDDFSPQTISMRPAKRTKTPSCYDILNSLSSSIHVTSGVKRKAIDFSRSGTPNFEKHFKSLDCAQSNNSHVLLQSRNLDIGHNKPEIREIYSKNSEINSNKSQESSVIKGILKTSNENLRSNLNKIAPENNLDWNRVIVTPDIHRNKKSGEAIDKSGALIKSAKLTDRLFMRAESRQNEQLKQLVEEQGIKVKFTTNIEEINKEDLRTMRQNNMKARLQSMFNAISGRADSEINPDVVIQADEVNTIKPVTSSPNRASLNSSTTTTNVNTAPISTSAVVPGGLSALNPDMKSTHINLNLSNTVSSNVQTTNTSVIKMRDSITKNEQIDKTMHQVASIVPIVTSTEPLQNTMISTSTVPAFSPGKLVSTSPTVVSSLLPSFGTKILNSNIIKSPSVTTSIPSTSINLLEVNKSSLHTALVPINSTSTTVELNNTITTNANVTFSTAASTQASSIFAFGDNKISSPVIPAVKTVTSQSIEKSTTQMLSSNTNVANIAFGNVTTSTPSNTVTTTSAQTSLFTFGNISSNSFASQPSKPDIFASVQSGNNVQATNTSQMSSENKETSCLSQDTTKSFNFSSNNLVSNANATNTTAIIGLSTTSTFSLTTSTISTSINKPLFVFGGNTENTMTMPTTSSNTAVFGTMDNNIVPTFGTPTTTIPQFGISTTTTPQFGASKSITSQFGTSTITIPQFRQSTTTIAPQFGQSTTTISSQSGIAMTSIPQFGTVTTITPQFGASTTTPQFMTPITTTSQCSVPIFGTITTSSAVSTSNTNVFSTANNQPIFGGTSTSTTTSIFNVPKTTTVLPFDSTTNVTSSTNTTSSNLFSNANTNVNSLNTSTTTASSVFGTSKTVFGETKSFGTTTNIFGSTTAPLFGAQTTTTSTFGITTTSTSTITPNFGAGNVTSTFGTPNAVTTANTQNTTSTFGGTPNIFGSTTNTANPIFGVNVTSTAGTFPSSATITFGGQQQQSANLTFGAAATSSTFGDNKSLFGVTPATTTSFGTPNSAIPTFGASSTNNTSNNTSNMFFGNNQKTEQQQNATFSFASNFNAGSDNSAPFQFGSTSSKPAAGFNFTAPSTVPSINFGTTNTPTFNATATPGMFNIGSGSTAPRSRTIRTRKLR